MNRFFDEDDRDDAVADRSGRVEFDDRGNAVWQSGRRKPKSPQLSIAEEEGHSNKHVKSNKAGMKSGYNPYESGMLKGGKKDGFAKKKDLAALSKWIQLKKNMGDA